MLLETEIKTIAKGENELVEKFKMTVDDLNCDGLKYMYISTGIKWKLVRFRVDC